MRFVCAYCTARSTCKRSRKCQSLFKAPGLTEEIPQALLGLHDVFVIVTIKPARRRQCQALKPK